MSEETQHEHQEHHEHEEHRDMAAAEPQTDEPGSQTEAPATASKPKPRRSRKRTSEASDSNAAEQQAAADNGATFPHAEAMGHDAVDRAAELLDRLSSRINQRVGGMGQGAEQPVERADVVLHDSVNQAEAMLTVAAAQALRLFARAREEAEDIWADAQHLREQWQR